jgi:hypothetical protein
MVKVSRHVKGIPPSYTIKPRLVRVCLFFFTADVALAKNSPNKKFGLDTPPLEERMRKSSWPEASAVNAQKKQ